MYAYLRDQDLLQRKAFSQPSRFTEASIQSLHHELTGREPHDHGSHSHGACACGGGCPKCQAKALAAGESAPHLDGASHTASSPIIGDESHATGRPLDRETRSFMESRFGHDFGDVRIHADSRGNRSADAVGARAYTSGNQIVFGTGHYAPDTHEGKALLAHELVHTIQQRGSSAGTRSALTFDAHPAETEARALSESAMRGRHTSPVRTMVAMSPRSVSLQLDPRKVYCALHAAVCLGLSENPPAAALCWMNFAARCGAGMASAAPVGASGAEAVAAAPPGTGTAGGETAGVPT